MIRAICLLVFLCTIGLARAQAQSGVITLTVVDAETGEEVPGAVIEIVPKAHPDQKKYYTSGYKGALQVRGLAYGSYTLAVTFMGYEKAEKEFRVTQPSENLGKIALREAAIAIETVVKEVQALRTSQKGDTVSYNANAFKVTADADVEGLLKKMPGITVNNGAVEAQGETIQKVFVDGKEFIDRKLMEEQKAGGLTRKLVGFKMIDRGIPRHGYQIASPEGDIIGQVTSGTMSPCLKQGIGMGYVKKEFAKVGTQIAIVIREKLMKAEVVKLPFIQQK
jgi:hypothetical protein